MYAKIQKLVIIAILVSSVGAIFSPIYVNADSTEDTVAICVNQHTSYDDVVLEITTETTGLNIKEQIAGSLDDGISPEDITIVYNPWATVLEKFPDEAKIEDYDIEEMFYVVSPLPMGAVYENNQIIDFDETAIVYVKHDGDSNNCYFTGENVVNCQGCEEISGTNYAKITIGDTIIYLEAKKNTIPKGFKVAHISYNPYEKVFSYGFEVVD